MDLASFQHRNQLVRSRPMGATSTQDPFSVRDNNIVIVGGTAGIGLAVAEHLVRVGAQVVITGRRPDGADIASDAGCSFVPMDVADDASVAAGFVSIGAVLGHIDCLILNAGVDLYHGEIDDLDMTTFEQVFQINTLGLVRSLAHGVKLMRPGGSVVATSSPAGSIAAPGMAAYSASKAALDMLVKTWALELGPKQIRVNALLPGIVESEMDAASTAELEVIRRMTANGVYRQAQEMGPIFQFLASPASGPLTGSLVGAHDGISVGYSHEVMGLIAADDGTDS
jgi:NAD(P)-dependent dehydrogenase (short-subunit alcohol dehydrogenase family)